MSERSALPHNRGWTAPSWRQARREEPGWWTRVDLPLLASTLALFAVGWLTLNSVDPTRAAKQFIFFAAGLVLALAAALLGPRKWLKLAGPLFALSLFLLGLVMVPGLGQAANGAQRWLSLGGFSFQPSEFAKLALIVTLAALLAPGATRGRTCAALGLSGLAFVLIALQPDLGTALVLAAICGVMCFVGGVSPLVLAALVTTALAVLPYVLKQYQRDRLLIFLHPEVDPQGLGYNLDQARTAIGSGGWLGHGLGAGPMTQHGFVPENWTDFLFTAIGEEMGLLGCAGFLLLAVILSACLARVALRCPDPGGRLLATGVFTMLVFQFLVNMAMTTGAAPVVGIPLPFASYGGTALLVNLMAVGIIAGISARRPRSRRL